MLKSSKFKYYNSKRNEISSILNIENSKERETLDNNIISMPFSNYLQYKSHQQYLEKLHSSNFLAFYLYTFYKSIVKPYLLDNLYETIKTSLLMSCALTFITNNNKVGYYFEILFNSIKVLGKQILFIN